MAHSITDEDIILVQNALQPRICPDCLEPLRRETQYGVTLDICARCTGYWFDDGELRVIMEEDPMAPLTLEDLYQPEIRMTSQASHERLCPACSVPLQPYHYLYDSPVELHSCPQCGGTWVQDGDLRKMYLYLQELKGPLNLEEERTILVASVDAQIITNNLEKQRVEDMQNFITEARTIPPWADAE